MDHKSNRRGRTHGAHAQEAACDLIKRNRAWRFLRLNRPNFRLFLHGKDPRMLGRKGESIILH
ncbi:hypothetical protein AHAS_Ahas01G0184500 [Arachis hypogaea]